MKLRFNKPAFALALLAIAASGAASAIDFKSIEPAAAILYDAPSTQAKRIFLLRRLTPVEVVVSVNGFVKVREPEGALGWVERKAISERRMLLATAPRTQVRVAADTNSEVVFEAERGVALEFVEPPLNGWVKVRHADGQIGFAHVTQLWGL